MNQKIISKDIKAKILGKLNFIYDEKRGEKVYIEIEKRVKTFLHRNAMVSKEEWIDERDVVVITYGDQIKEPQKLPLESLDEFLNNYLKGIISNVHILPFYPYSSDDGFSVIDYFEVDSKLGEWHHIEKLSNNFNIMFDAVINHISAKSSWFKGYMEGNGEYENYFIEADFNADYSTVTRPRALPLLSKFNIAGEERHIWTTFSEDQIDLNYKNEEVLLKIIDLLLFYIEKGAKLIRLDAIGYMWKELGTSCIHLEQTHLIVQLFRDIFELVAPSTIIITETNVPHKDNISYFGNGYNEAHMVYQFPLPPLTLNTFLTGNAKYLQHWAASLETISPKTTFFNFLASHDGIGVMPVKGILTDEEIENMVRKVKERGGNVSYKSNGNGTESPYELNINYFDALSDSNEEETVKIDKFIGAQSILLTLAGVPGIYIHSLLGSRNYQEGVKETGMYRSINREKIDRETLEKDLNNSNHLRHKVFSRYTELIKKRRKEKAFHPMALQKILLNNEHVFTVLRTAVSGEEKVLCLHNVSRDIQQIKITFEDLEITTTILRDILTEKNFHAEDGIFKIDLAPYEILWLK